MIHVESEEEVRAISISMNNGTVSMRDLRDFIEATESASETAILLVLPGEIRYEPQS